MSERDTLILGDLHGHLDRFEALLRQEGLLDRCEVCDGTGEKNPDTKDLDFCENCHGDGWARTDKPADVVLVGDVGHFGADGSLSGDTMTWSFATKWADVILWGNHDRAVVDDAHIFGGYVNPTREIIHLMQVARSQGKLKLAHACHDFLITHAGLHASFASQNVPVITIKQNPYRFANWINRAENPDAEVSYDQVSVRDAISHNRGGTASAGGILWRDIDEKLFVGFRQVFGHSSDRQHKVRVCWRDGYKRVEEGYFFDHEDSYCIDIGGKGNRPGDNCLAGLWLPQEKVVTVRLG